MFCLDLCRGTVFHHLAVRCFYFAAPFLLNILKTIHHQLNLVLDNAPEPFALYVNEHRTATLGISFYIIFTLISKVLTFLLRPMLEGYVISCLISFRP